MSSVEHSDAEYVDSVVATDLPDELFTPREGNLVVSVKCRLSLANTLSEYQPVITSAANSEFINVDIQFADISSVCTFAMKFPGQVEVVAPDAARVAVLTSVSSTMSNMSGSQPQQAIN